MDMDRQQVLIEVSTKVVNSINRRGDEGENIRLLSSFQDQFPYRIKEMEHIRSNVIKVWTTNGVFVLKGYSSYSRLKLQETFTSSLKKEGFEHTYSFIQLNQDPIVYKDQYFGVLPYIEPYSRSFSYRNDKERKEGLELLNKFHKVTKHSVKRYQTIVPRYNLKKKWTERHNQFLKNVQTVAKFVPREIISEWLRWSEWSLEGIQKHYDVLENDKPVILHGDVAHHNFLRQKDGKLLLIDFDLISIGSKKLDLLQYANRILPHMYWNKSDFMQYKRLTPLFSHPLYLYALVYPTDLFREWNRLIREGSIRNKHKLQSMKNQSLLRMNVRQQFNNEIISMLNK